jgi:hypothetical protein
MRRSRGSGLGGLGTIAASGVIALLLFFVLMMVPPLITATVLVVGAIAIAAFYLWHWATRARA